MVRRHEQVICAQSLVDAAVQPASIEQSFTSLSDHVFILTMCQAVFQALGIQKVNKNGHSPFTPRAQSLVWDTAIHQIEDAKYK